jgi:YqaJ-like viral recombinase domain
MTLKLITMLQKSKISGVKILSDEWFQNRLAKFTSSEIFNLIGEGMLNYVRRKVGEDITGKPAKGDIDTEATRWGGFYEAEAINKFGLLNKLDFLIVQQLICDPIGRFGCTPDGLIVKRESIDKLEYEVETVEVKCPFTFDAYLRLFECENAQDLKQVSKQYYWQVLDQMDNCGCLVAHFVVYHPDFKCGNMKTFKIEAMQLVETPKGKDYPIYNDLKLLREKKKQAEEKFDELRYKLMRIPAV